MGEGNFKKKVSAMFLAAAMIAISFPAFRVEVHAAESPDISQFAETEQLKSFNTDDTDGAVNPAKVYFGQNGSGSTQAVVDCGKPERESDLVCGKSAERSTTV